MEGSSLAKALAHIRQTQMRLSPRRWAASQTGARVDQNGTMADFRQFQARRGRRSENVAPRRRSAGEAAEKANAYRGAAGGGRHHPVRLPSHARENFLNRHAETVYRKLTRNLSDFPRVDELAYDAAAPRSRPDADAQTGRGRKHIDAERERRRRSRPGYFSRASAGCPRHGIASLRSDAAAETGGLASAAQNSSRVA